MKLYEVRLPIIRGQQMFNVHADSPEQAIELVLQGEYESCDEFDCIEVDFDSNLAEVDEIR